MLPILTARIFDNVIPSHDTQKLWLVTGLIVVVLLAITAATLLQRYLLSVVSVRFDVSSLDHLTERLLSLPMSYFSTRRTGDIERRLSGARQVRAFVTASGIQVLTSVMQLGAALALMFFWNWQLALVYLATIPPYILLMRFSSTRLRPLYDDLEASYGRYSSGQIDAIRGIETVKAMAAEDSLRRLMLNRFQTPDAADLPHPVHRAHTYQGSLQLVNLASFAVFLLVGSLEVINGGLTKGQFVAYNTLIALANGPVLSLLGLWDQLQQTRVLLMRLDDVLEQEPEQGADRSQLVPVKSLEGRVELRNVGFRYGGPDTPPILEGLTFSVAPGETIAIVGRSGSGKTTLVKLLSGLLEPTEGAIQFDGHDMRTLDYRTLRRQIGFVLQENYLFNESIAGNIAFGEAEVDPGRLVTRGEGSERARVRPAAAARLRDADRRVRPAAVGRPAAAGGDRAGAVPPAADPALRRGDERARHGVGAGGEAEPRRAARRPDVVRDRAPAEHDPRRRPDPRARAGASRRAGHARRADRAAGALLLSDQSTVGAVRPQVLG